MKIIFVILLFSISGCINPANHDKTVQKNEPPLILPKDAIPFEYVNGRILMQMKVNDSINARFLFDSGSDQLYLDSTFIAQNNIPVHKTKLKQIHGVGPNRPMVPLIEKIQLGFQALTKKYENVPVTGIRDITDCDGVFGTDFFKNNILKINFDSCYILMISPSTFHAPIGYDSLQLFISGNKTIIKCSSLIIDSVIVDGFTILDLGSSHALTFTSIIANENKFEDIIKNKYQYIRANAGYGGNSSSFYFRAKNIKIANAIIQSPVLDYSSDTKGALSWRGINGLLGTEVLERFTLIFDFPNKKLYLKPGKKFNEHFYSNVKGFFSKVNGQKPKQEFVVVKVIDGSSAYIAGLKAGDVITELNGKDVFSYSELERKEIFNQVSSKLHFTVNRNGENLNIEILPKELL